MGDNPDRLAAELRSARAAKKLSLRGAATISGISAAYLQKLERGLVEAPSPPVLERLSRALDLDYARLMRLAGYAPVAAPPVHDPLAVRLAEAQLTEVEERAIAAFVDHLLNQRPE